MDLVVVVCGTSCGYCMYGCGGVVVCKENFIRNSSCCSVGSVYDDGAIL